MHNPSLEGIPWGCSPSPSVDRYSSSIKEGNGTFQVVDIIAGLPKVMLKSLRNRVKPTVSTPRYDWGSYLSKFKQLCHILRLISRSFWLSRMCLGDSTCNPRDCATRIARPMTFQHRFAWWSDWR